MSQELISRQASAALPERLRQSIRKIFPRSLYGYGSRALDAFYAVRVLGFSQSHNIRRNLATAREPVEVKIRNFPHPVFVRPGTTDFAELLYTMARSSYGAYLPQGEVRTILDAGGYIGDTAIWYLNRFPRARVISLEPSSENLALLKKNTEPYGERVTILNAALWPRTTGLKIRGSSHDGFSVQECDTNPDCHAISMSELLETFAPEGFDIFKCDIEGRNYRSSLRMLRSGCLG